MQKLISTLLLLSISLSTQTNQAAECDPLIASCRKALESKNKALSLADLALSNCITLNGKAYELVEEKNKQLDAWYRKPVLMFVLGAAAGGVAFAVLRR